MTGLTIGIGATKAPWSAALRSYLRDHSQGVAVEVIMDRPGLARAISRIDVLVMDDIMRMFSITDIARAQDGGVHVVGLFDQGAGMGRQYLNGLGVDQVLPASLPSPELAVLLEQVKPRLQARSSLHERASWSTSSAANVARRTSGFLSAWTKASGGAGLTEAVVAAAEHLARRSRVLLIEADEVAPVLASRLLRSPDTGLAWAASRAGQGLSALPEGLSGPRGDGTAPLGHFDVICGTPGAANVISPAQADKLLDEALGVYDHVLVETSWLIGSPAPRERFSAARAVLQKAGSVVVLTSADPEGAARLVQWKAAAFAAGVAAPCWAAFGRANKSRYERDHLRSLVEGNTGQHPFVGFASLPEDPTVLRARWNAELVWKGPWARSLRELATSVVPPLGAPGAPARRLGYLGQQQRRVLAGAEEGRGSTEAVAL
jgi:hypothetical protein